ncbi:MAG TPA: sensor histidine kinase [Streptosporangiaceae bacterium]
MATVAVYPRRWWITDAAIAVIFAVAGQVELGVHTAQSYPGTAPWWANSVLAVLVVAALPWRRRAPLTAVCLIGAAMAVPRLIIDNTILFWGGLLPFAFAVFTAARHAASPRDRLALLAPAGVLIVFTFRVHGFREPNEYLFSGLVFAIAWLAGQGIRRWQRDSTRLSSALTELEGTHELRAAAAVTAERTRIARELHDIIAHSMSVMVLQAGSARLELHDDQQVARDALRAVEATGRQALVEMRRLLGILRTDSDELSLSPQPGLADLPALVERLDRTGLQVTATVHGAPVTLPPSADLSAYRIVQEALTNALKHGACTEALVSVAYQPGHLDLAITNPASGGRRPRDSAGHGLVGMRERVALFGGELEAGPSPDGTFTVRVRLPITAAT